MTLCVTGMLCGGWMAFDAEALKVVGSSVKPPPVYVGTKDGYVRAAQGGYCYSAQAGDGKIVATCIRAVYPPRVSSQLPVVGRQRLIIDAGKRVKRLRGSLLQVEGEEVTHLRTVRARRTGEGRFWRLRLPAALTGADVLSLDLDFGAKGDSKGDSNVWAGLAPDGQASARIPSARASKSTG